MPGDAGVGKSRLTREFGLHAHLCGWVVLRGRAVPGGQPVPYRPLPEALIAGCRRFGTPEEEDLVPYRPVLDRLLPQWHGPELVPGVASSVVLGEGVLRLLRALGADAGVVLVVEDLHWADPETLGVLEYLADHVVEQPLVVVVTIRPEPSAGLDMTRELVGRRAAVPVALPPLPAAEVAAMATSALDAKELPVGLEELLARAEGVPFLVEELLAAATDAGVLVRDGGSWTVHPGADSIVPRALVDVVARRVDGLPAPDQAVPRVAALLGRRQVDVELLGRVLGRDRDGVAAVLARCVELQLLVVDATGFVFRHALTREAVMAGSHPDERAIWAGRARAAP